MKNILVLSTTMAIALVSTAELSAQSESTALSLAEQHEARGSARYQALSGAMGAIGADFSAVHQNPAGLSYFRSGGKVSLSLSNSTYGAKNTWGERSTSLSSRNRFQIDELSFLGSYMTSSGINVAYGIGIQNNGRFQRSLNAYSTFSGETSSLADYSVASVNNLQPIPAPSNNPYAGQPWVSALGYESTWMDYDASSGRYRSGYNSSLSDGSLIWDERGAVSNLDLAVAAEFSSAFSLGAGLTFSTLNYEYTSFYQEARNAMDANGQRYGLSLDNRQSISGVGVRFSLGFLVRPTESLRLGASVYSPTLYTNMSIDTYARGTGLSQIDRYSNRGAFEATTPRAGSSEFGLNTPWRFTLSGAYVFGRQAILSVDYEYQNYSGIRLKNATNDDYLYSSDNIYSVDNSAIKEDLGETHTLRVGLEYNLTNRLALRLGYRTTSTPLYTADLKKAQPEVGVLTSGTAVHYRLPEAVHAFSLGLGYRLSPKWALDLAYAMRTQNAKVGAFPYIRDEVNNIRYFPMEMIKDKQTQHNLTATISYRF